MTDRELLREINALCRRHAHFGVNVETHRLASIIAKSIESHLGEECGQGSDEKVSEVAHG